jgi:hypothetical protein
MKSTIFIVTGSSGEYSDRCDWNICAFSTKDLAEKCIEKIKLLVAFNDNFYETFVQGFDKEHFERYSLERVPNPPRPEPSSEYRRLEKLLYDKEATPEDREAFKKVMKDHQDNMSLWSKACDLVLAENNKLYWKMEENRKRAITENYNPPPDLQEVVPYCGKTYERTSHRDIRYDIDELELVG